MCQHLCFCLEMWDVVSKLIVAKLIVVQLAYVWNIDFIRSNDILPC